MKLSFDTNKPIEVCLMTLDGESCESQFGGPQRKYQTTDRDVFYVSEPVGKVIADTCRKLRIEEREPVVICKAEVPDGRGRKQIRWQVTRVNALGQQADGTFAVPADTNGANGVHPSAPSAPAVQQAQPALTQQSNGNAPPPANGHAVSAIVGSIALLAAPLPAERPKTKLEDALKTVVAACHAARNYAKDIGYDMPTFTGDDLARMANTLMINGAQNGNGHNGGPR